MNVFMKKSEKIIVISILGLVLGAVLLLFLLTIGTTVHIGWRNDIVQDEWRQAENRWGNRDFFGAISKGIRVSWMTIDCGIRTTISGSYFRQSAVLESQGQFKQALDVCLTGARFTSQYDMEGVMDYQCAALEMRHHILFPANNLSAPALTPTIEP